MPASPGLGLSLAFGAASSAENLIEKSALSVLRLVVNTDGIRLRRQKLTHERGAWVMGAKQIRGCLAIEIFQKIVGPTQTGRPAGNAMRVARDKLNPFFLTNW